MFCGNLVDSHIPHHTLPPLRAYMLWLKLYHGITSRMLSSTEQPHTLQVVVGAPICNAFLGWPSQSTFDPVLHALPSLQIHPTLQSLHEYVTV